MLDQRVRYLRDAENEDQVEKQFGEVDPGFLARCELAQKPCLDAHHVHDLHLSTASLARR